ncbi:MAG: hypothetical protein J5506_03765 [Prevotella sp.]|nr:hypothetical protein [Prevotella sp.]
MPIYRGNINSTLKSIINNSSDGENKQFFYHHPCKKELDTLLFFASNLESKDRSIFIRVNYDWEYGLRARRIDLVSKEQNTITLYKKSSKFSTDSNAIDLSRIKDSVMKSFPNLIVKCVLLYSERIEEKSVRQTLESLKLDVDFQTIV